ncbi:hypothetical protein STPH2_0372 [Streptomyces sp. KO7888]|nr:hypothetical protein [Streptomyces sp. KO7888]
MRRAEVFAAGADAFRGGRVAIREQYLYMPSALQDV